MALSRKESEDLKPLIDKVVNKFLGFSEPTLVTAAINCLDKAYDKRKTIDKLGDILDNGQASKFTDKLFAVYDDFRSVSHRDKSKKRKITLGEDGDSKKSKIKDEPLVGSGASQAITGTAQNVISQPSPGQLTTDKIKEMMANAQKMIQERKAQLTMMPPIPSVPPAATVISYAAQQQSLMSDAVEKARKANELQARIQSKLQNIGLATPASQLQIPTGPTPVILDEEGRTIDVKTGQAIQLQHHMPTLKANIRAKKREQFKAVHEKPPEEISESKFFDGRLGMRAAQRTRRSFKFHEKGKYEHLAQRLRTKAQLEKLQNEIAQAAKKTGIASAAKLATIQPKTDTTSDDVPDIEWWDAVILKNETYGSVDGALVLGRGALEGITHLVEHPVQIKPPVEIDKHVQIAVMLTKKERNKLRRQNRTEGQKEIQEKIRLGLMPPPEPKVRMANLMRVLGTEAVQDPTKVEAHVRAQMAKRQRGHEEANAARKLTKEQKREKKIKKIKENTSAGVHVCVYRVRDFTNPSKKFKVEKNAAQLFMTGIVILHKDCNVIVVEGGPKQQRKFRKLVLQRIKWSEDQQSKNTQADDGDTGPKKVNTCHLVWEGMVKSRAFGEMKFKASPTENFAREQFKKFGVEHYWDLAFSSFVLEEASKEES